MFQVDESTAVSALPAPAAAGTPGYFTNGNPATGVAATIVDADWLNMIQQELLNIVAAGGLTPSKTVYNQVLLAIKRLHQTTSVLADTGTANAYAATNAVPLTSTTWVDGVVQAVKIAHANTTASTYAPDGLSAIPIYGLGLQPLQGSELVVGGNAILMRTTISTVNSGNPICILMECAGGAQQVAPATASQHATNLSQFASTLSSSGYQKLPSGLILQWGFGSSSGTAASNFSAIFPIAFPNACLCANLTVSGSTAGNYTVQYTSSTTTTLKGTTELNGSYASAVNVVWIAIGY